MKHLPTAALCLAVVSLAVIGCQKTTDSNDPAAVTPAVVPAVAKIVEGDALGASNIFGCATAIDGDYAIVGDAWSGSDSQGNVWVFHRTGDNAWDGGVKLVAGDATAQDYFGSSVAISGDYAIVGATDTDTGGASAGSAYVFHRTGTNSWSSGVKLVASDPAAGDNFGCAVSISGDYAIAGAQFKADASGSNPKTGAAYIFHRTGDNSWDGGSKIVPAVAIENNRFGISVGISGDYVIAGTLNNNGVDTRTGSAYLFQRTGTNAWSSGGIITASDATAGARFGISAAIDGNRAIVGSDNGGGSWTGSAYIFTRTGSSWDSGAKIVAPDATTGDCFGTSVAIKGGVAMVGATYKKNSALQTIGAAYVYKYAGSSWDSGSLFMVDASEVNARFGEAVAVSSDYALAGAPYGATIGTAYIKYIK